MNNKYKFEIGQIVTHVASKSHDPQFVVVSRGLMEHETGTEEVYNCSNSTLSCITRITFASTELKSADK